MNERARFLSIQSFLAQHQAMWDDEIIYSYPQCFDFFPYEWTLELMTAPYPKLFRFASTGDDTFIINKKFRDFLFTIKSLQQLPSQHPLVRD
jgi:hypothetical protein